jgi:hypothetical protein
LSFADFWASIAEGQFTADTESTLVGGAIRYGLQNGLSGQTILGGLQQAGLGVRRQTFYQLLRNERATIAAGLGAVDQRLTELPTATAIKEVSVGRPGTYVTNIRTTYRVASGQGDYHLEQKTISVTSRTAITPQQAMDVAADIWSEHSANYPNQTILDMAYMGTLLHTGKLD